MNNKLAGLPFSILTTACASSSGGSAVTSVGQAIRYVPGACRDGR